MKVSAIGGHMVHSSLEHSPNVPTERNAHLSNISTYKLSLRDKWDNCWL